MPETGNELSFGALSAALGRCIVFTGAESRWKHRELGAA